MRGTILKCQGCLKLHLKPSVAWHRGFFLSLRSEPADGDPAVQQALLQFYIYILLVASHDITITSSILRFSSRPANSRLETTSSTPLWSARGSCHSISLPGGEPHPLQRCRKAIAGPPCTCCFHNLVLLALSWGLSPSEYTPFRHNLRHPRSQCAMSNMLMAKGLKWLREALVDTRPDARGKEMRLWQNMELDWKHKSHVLAALQHVLTFSTCKLASLEYVEWWDNPKLSP